MAWHIKHPKVHTMNAKEEATLGQLVGAIVDLEQEMLENTEEAWQDLQNMLTPDPSWTPSTTIRQILTPEQLELWNDHCLGTEHPDAISRIADTPFSEITSEDAFKILGIPFKDPPENGRELIVKFLMCCNSAEGRKVNF
jgi:hypothetical protein